MTIYELALHFKEMRDMQTAYFASKKENRWGDKKLLAASKAKEAELDELVRGIVAAGEGTSCAGDCGMNYCDDNGCMERKRVVVDPAERREGGEVGV